MHCRSIKVAGVSAIVCGSGPKRCKCGRRSTRLCDWKTPARQSGTCDRPLCDRCAVSPAPEKDLCPAHADEWKARRVHFSSLK